MKIGYKFEEAITGGIGSLVYYLTQKKQEEFFLLFA